MAYVHTSRLSLFYTDMHIPKEETRKVDLVVDVQRQEKPDDIIIMGDFIDGDAASTFASDVNLIDQYEEFQMGNNWLDTIQNAAKPKAKITYLLGNHEYRFYREANIPQALRRLCDPIHWLGLNERGIRWVPYEDQSDFMVGPAYVFHGKGHTKFEAGKAAMKMGGPAIFVHTHRFQVIRPVEVRNDWIGYNIGCLCRKDQKYMQCKYPDAWVHAFALMHYTKSGKHTIQPITIQDNGAFVNNTEYII